MKKIQTILFALMMVTVSLTGCLGGDSEIPDEDYDGVEDGLDICPQTPGQGVESAKDLVDEYGCSQLQYDQGDTDEDDVMNSLDNCQSTPTGETVDANGCAQSELDDDEDGVMNDVDLCPDTQLTTGETADADGCDQSQLDELNDGDGDGVLNDVDLCPNSPPITGGNWHVADGCLATQFDDDGDGVMNRRIIENDPGSTGILDLCPNTPAGKTVDADGCSQWGREDADGDGVNNHDDMCQDTPAGGNFNWYGYYDNLGCSSEQWQDPDADGVKNYLDDCPNTPTGETVDENGCSYGQFDDDEDGVENSPDQCSDTPAGETVDANGCAPSQLDDDGDGVMNDADLCPNTPAGETFDADGCTQWQLEDDDGDGVMNSLDNCQSTPTGETVDANGCAQSELDDDEDGVMNDADLCPNTPFGGMIDADGCTYGQLDDDEDGVENNLDLCSNTLPAETVDVNGCAPYQLDDDGDGVMNDVDLCPDTPTGETFDADGCTWKQRDDDGDSVVNDADLCPHTAAGETVDADGCSQLQYDDVDSDGVMNDVDQCARTSYGSNADSTGCGGYNDVISADHISRLHTLNDEVYFFGLDSTNGRALWKDDSTSGLTLVKVFNSAATEACENCGMTKVNAFSGEVLYFYEDDGVHGTELWRTDGTESGTVMLKDIHPHGGSMVTTGLNNPVAMGNMIYFWADDYIHGAELWKTDGTELGTVMVKDIYSNHVSSIYGIQSSPLIVFGNNLFFNARSSYEYEYELWKSDGTESGTVMVKDINPLGHSHPTNFTVVGNTLYFTAVDDTNGEELWRTDGTESGTMMIKDIRQGTLRSYIQYPTAFDDNLYFSATDAVNGLELWKSDGTETGTVMVKDINIGGSSFLGKLIVVDNVLYFEADDGINGCQLWKSDGTETGTVMVNSTSSSTYSGHKCGSDYLNFGTSLYFRANQSTNSNISGWVSDGTPEGANIIDGFYGSDSVVATSWWLFGHGTSLYIQVNLASGQVLLVKISI